MKDNTWPCRAALGSSTYLCLKSKTVVNPRKPPIILTDFGKHRSTILMNKINKARRYIKENDEWKLSIN